MTTVSVHVDHVVAATGTDWSVTFSDLSYSVSLAEDALVNTLVKNISIVNKPTHGVVAVACEIVSGNENGNKIIIIILNNYLRKKKLQISANFENFLFEV